MVNLMINILIICLSVMATGGVILMLLDMMDGKAKSDQNAGIYLLVLVLISGGGWTYLFGDFRSEEEKIAEREKEEKKEAALLAARPYPGSQKSPLELKAEALAEWDASLRNYREEKQAELKSKAVSYKTFNSAGMTIESFVMKNGSVVTCKTTFPGPVYECDD